MRLEPAKPLADFTELEWDGQLFRGEKSLAAMLGWRYRYHTLRSKGSQPGFPDRVLARERVVFAETKSETGKPSAAQVVWLDALASAGAEVYLWRPSDLDEVAQVLSKRWRLEWTTEPLGDRFPGLRLMDGWPVQWRPSSLWIPGVGRWDAHPKYDPSAKEDTQHDR